MLVGTNKTLSGEGYKQTLLILQIRKNLKDD